MPIRRSALVLAVLPFVLAAPAGAQSFRGVEIISHDVAEGIWMLEGAGGNIGLCAGADGAFLIDDQFAPLTGKILEAVQSHTEQPVRFVVNTHFHFDHTGGNENLGAAGSVIVAHANVRLRLSTEQFNEALDRRTPPSPPEALPKITFEDAVTFHWNGQTIDVFHVAPAHTDGDSVVHFREANVVHTGDVFFNGLYPFIDYSSAGHIDGVIAAVDRVLGIVDDDTRIIPGHGPLADRDDLVAYRAMLQAVRDRVGALIEAGKDKDEVVAAKPTASFDERWGGGFLTPEQFAGLVYEGMVRHRAAAEGGH